MFFAALPKPSQPYNWTTDPTILAWITVASLIVGVLGIVAGIAIGYWFYRKGRNWHQVIYEVISDTPIVSVREQIGRGKIKVTYEASGGQVEEINDARLLTLKVLNSGNGDVLIWSTEDKVRANFETPIQFEFEGRTVVGLTHLQTDPSRKVIQQEDFDAYLNAPSPSPTCLGLPRCLLKQDQSIQLGILLNGPSGSIKLKEGKILNGEIVNIFDLERRKRIFPLIISVLMVVFVIGLFSSILSLLPPNYFTLFLVISIVSIVILILVLFYLFRNDTRKDNFTIDRLPGNNHTINS